MEISPQLYDVRGNMPLNPKPDSCALMLSTDTARSLLLSCCTLLLARMNIIAALDGAAAVAIGAALGEFIGAAADMSVDCAGPARGRTLRWRKRVPCAQFPSATKSELRRCKNGISFDTRTQTQPFEHHHPTTTDRTRTLVLQPTAIR